MRYKLLSYYTNPAGHAESRPNWDKCDSNFEREVGKMIYDKQFRVIPQHEPFGPGDYRIDFVIEGLKSRLAVEVDGPHHENPEQIAHDIFRQRQLERCKWVFWRVSASNFYFDKEKSMAPLWRKLAEMGIEPLRESHVQAKPQAFQAKENPPCAATSTSTGEPLAEPVTRIPTPNPFIPTQPELIPTPQPCLPTQQKMEAPDNRTENSSDPATLALQSYIAEAKRKDPHGILPSTVIEHVVLSLIPYKERIDRQVLVKNVSELLEFHEAGVRRINDAIKMLVKLKHVDANNDSVWRRKN